VPGLVASAGIATIVVLTRPSTFGLEALDHGFADGARRTARSVRSEAKSGSSLVVHRVDITDPPPCS
jgi:hypothetical protein